MKLGFLFSFQLLFTFFVNGTVASDYAPEIITVSFKKTKYYCLIYAKGDSVSKDLKYYNNSGEFIQNVSDRVKECFKKTNAIRIYKNIEIIDLSKFNGYNEQEKKLYILNNQLIHLPIDFIDNIKVLNLMKGNSEHFIYSPDLKTEDNEWISRSRIKKYLDFDDGEICNMSLFAIKDSISSEHVKFYKSKLIELRSPDNPEFIEFLKVLYRQKIIVIGFCDD